jgi:dCTP deaminase
VCVTPDGSNDEPKPGEGKYLRIPPGQFALLCTLESLDIPHNAMGFISVKTSEKIKGLINVSGFHVDPGFKGHLKFSVYNAGNRLICLDYGSECFLLWLCSIDRETKDTWDVKNKFLKSEIKAQEREQMSEESHSPAALDTLGPGHRSAIVPTTEQRGGLWPTRARVAFGSDFDRGCRVDSMEFG